MEILISIIFLMGYVLIALEHTVGINKAATALMTGTLCWTVFMLFQVDKTLVTEQLNEHLANISEILFFLLGAMTIVELIDAHEGFEIIIDKIKTKNYRKLLWIVAFLSFFLSAILDNLTTTIVMISLTRKIISDRERRLIFIGIIIIAANAGGAWSPIGDVTTTMLWIKHQITVKGVIQTTFLASLACLLLPLLLVTQKMKGHIVEEKIIPTDKAEISTTTAFERNFVLILGVGILIFVPVFKTITHLPPYIAMLLGLGFMWMITELVHSKKNEEDKDPLTVVFALRKIDTPSILFFLGILLSVASLESIGQLHDFANFMTDTIGNDAITALTIGLLSAIVDNVPLVAAAQGMYSLDLYPTDHFFWSFLAYSTGTGGSALIIGSAAGVTAMGMEKINFFWYFKNISWLALIGYIAGAGVYILQSKFF